MYTGNCFCGRRVLQGCRGLGLLVVLGALIPVIVLTAHAPATAEYWTYTGSLLQGRCAHTATLLQNGQVLAAGGEDSGSEYLGTSEIYNPSSTNPSYGTWTSTESALYNARVWHTATRLLNGQVLVAGGWDSNALQDSEYFDPSYSVWDQTYGQLITAREMHTATLLQNGQVLVAGGVNSTTFGTFTYLPDCEIYDPTYRIWNSTNSLNNARYLHTATRLLDGTVLVVAGMNSDIFGNFTYLSDSEIYDPNSRNWTEIGSTLNSGRVGHTATRLLDGTVLVTGGANGNGSYLSDCALYDPNSQAWTPTSGNLNTPRYLHTATLLPSGLVLVAGGYNDGGALSSCEIYDPSSQTWTPTVDLAYARYWHTATPLINPIAGVPNGQVLVAGGYTNSGDVTVLNSCEIFIPTAPQAPTGATASPGDTQATVGFTPPASTGGSAVTGYTVASNPTGGVDADAGSTSTTHTVTGLTNGTTYTFTITATNAIGTGPPSDPSNSITPGKAPDPPTGLTASAGNGQATVGFTPPTSDSHNPITGYTVYSNPTGGSDANAGSTSTTHTVTGLTNGTTYTFTVTATNAIGTGLPSDPSTSVTPGTVPDAPTGVTASAGNAQATVTFSPPPSDGGSSITGYTVTSSGGQIAQGTASPITVTGLTNGTTYTFTVTATNFWGPGPSSSPSTGVTPGTIPGAPTGATATAGNAQATVTFSPPPSDGGSSIMGYTVTSSGGQTAQGTASPITVTGLTNGTTYSFTVIATNFWGPGPASSPSTGATPGTIPGAPTGATASAGNAQATVNFTPPASDGGSSITAYIVTSSPGGNTGSGTGSGITVTGLTNGTTYTFTVVATNFWGPGPASTSSTGVTPGTVPGAPTGVTASAGNAQATVTFLPPASNGGSAITGYTVISNPSGGVDANAGSASTTHTVTNLINGTPYTFTVTATNSWGTGLPSTPSTGTDTPVTPGTVPGAPTGASASAGISQATVTFTAPTSNGGSPITGYTVISDPSGGTDLNAGSTSTSHTVTGLTNGTFYTFTVTATNSWGTGSPSTPSKSVKPVGQCPGPRQGQRQRPSVPG